MNKKLLITAISIALMGSASMVINPVYADPKNPTAIEASCKNNAEKKDWCQSQEQPAPSQDQNTTDNSTPNQDQNTTSEDTDDSESSNTGSEENITTTNNTTGEDNTVTDSNSTETDSNNTEFEDTTLPSTEELFTQANEAGIFVSVEATIEWLVTNGISPETLTEEQRNELPIDWNSPQLPIIEEQPTTDESEIVPTEDEVIPTEGEVVPTEDEVIPTEGEVVATEDEVIPTEGEVVSAEDEVVPTEGGVVTDEVIPTEDEVVPTEGEVVTDEVVPTEDEVVPTEGEVVTDEVVPTEDEVVPTEDEVVPTEGEVVTNESVEPTDVNESTFSPLVSEEVEQVIQAQLEVVNDIVVVDEEGNETSIPVEETKVIGEVLIPQAEEEGANAVINGELLNVKVEFGVAEATTADEEQEPVILTTVTGLEITVPTIAPEAEVDTSNLITLQQDETGNFILRIPNLKVGDLVVNVILKALTETLDIYQVEEVTIAPEKVFNNEDSTEEAAVETTEPSDEEATAEETI